jgi:hypothetical protein
MATATHATLATFRMDPSREAEQRVGLEQMIGPGVRRHPGFVSGTWTLDRETSTSSVMLTFDSREAAESMRGNVVENDAGQAAVGIELVDIRVLEVMAAVLG